MRRLSLVVALLVVATGACSNDTADPAATRPSTDMRGKLIVVSDLPSGYTRLSIEEREPAATSSEFCADIDNHRRNFPGERVAEAQFRRTKGTATMFVNEQITRYVDEAEAARAFSDFEKALGQCGSVTKKNDTSSIAGSFEPVEFAQVGDETYATSFNATQTVDEDSASISGYFVAFRARRYVVLLSSLGTIDTPQKKDAEAIAKKAVARI